MIVGKVTSDGTEARVDVVVQNAAGEVHEVQAVVDTGFDGFLTLPTHVVMELGLPLLGSVRAMLADGSVRDVPLHLATLLWGGEEYVVEVECVETTPLLGMDLLAGYRLRIECQAGGRVDIERLP